MGIVGSTAYGLDHAGSDIDRLGVYVAPIDDVLGIENVTETIVQHEPDIVVHEVAKLVRLALRCNPTITETLWLGKYEQSTHDGRELVRNRRRFLSAKCVRGSYLGYASDQFKRIKRRESNDFSSDTKHRVRKHSIQMRRLAIQGAHLWRTGELVLKVDDPQAYFDFGDAVQAGDLWPVESLMVWAEKQFEPKDCALPEMPDRWLANELVVDIRRGQLEQECD